jgi:hypothetical protein
MEQDMSDKPWDIFVIVEGADAWHWKTTFTEDPKVTGVSIGLSCHRSFRGSIAGIKQSYSSSKTANDECIRINDMYPGYHYGVCKVNPRWTNHL